MPSAPSDKTDDVRPAGRGDAGFAARHLRAVSEKMNDGYTDDCVHHALRMAEVLLREGFAPWIGRVREVTVRGDRVFHAPLTPLRFTGRHALTWNTHYVCCCEGAVYDPIAGEPVPLGDYARVVFGRPIDVVEHLSAEKTAGHVRNGTFRAAFRPVR